MSIIKRIVEGDETVKESIASMLTAKAEELKAKLKTKVSEELFKGDEDGDEDEGK